MKHIKYWLTAAVPVYLLMGLAFLPESAARWVLIGLFTILVNGFLYFVGKLHYDIKRWNKEGIYYR